MTGRRPGDRRGTSRIPTPAPPPVPAPGGRVLVEARSLTAGHAGVPAVRGLDLTVEAGEVLAILGPNGAGKTTSLLTIAGVLPPIDGYLRVVGEEVPRHRPHLVARRGVVLVPEQRGIFQQMTVAENLRLAAPARRRHRRQAIDAALDHLPALRDLLGRRCGLLSGGEQQMLALARAVVAEPKVVLIDELSLGLAPIVVERLLPAVRALATDRDAAVVLVEQHVPMALQIADRACVLRQGTPVFVGPASEIDENRGNLADAYLGTDANGDDGNRPRPPGGVAPTRRATSPPGRGETEVP